MKVRGEPAKWPNNQRSGWKELKTAPSRVEELCGESQCADESSFQAETEEMESQALAKDSDGGSHGFGFTKGFNDAQRAQPCSFRI